MNKSSLSQNEWKTIKSMLDSDSSKEGIINAINYAYLTGFDDGMYHIADI